MRLKFTLFFTLLCLGFTFVNAQNCDPLSEPDVAADGCACAYPDCAVGLNGFSGTLGDPNGFQTAIPECTDGNGGTFHNDDWIAFIAGSTSISITITPTNCDVVGNLSGVQAGFYGNCNDNPNIPDDEGVPSDGLLVQCACSVAPLTLDYDDFVCGQTYYIFLDGCGGSVCDYTIVVNSGSTTLNAPDPLGAITGPTDVCPGATVTYSVDEVFCVPDYDWEVTGGGVIVSEDGNTCTVTWNSAGTISTMGENACFMTNSSGPLNVTVTPLPELNAVGEYCDNEPGYVYPPNGQTYTVGDHVISEVIMSGVNMGCTQNTNLSVSLNPTYNYIVDRVICYGEQVIYGGLPYSNPGTYDINLQTINTFCDSNITLNIQVLDPLAIVSVPPPLDEITCTNTSVLVDGSQSFPAQDIEVYNWTSPTGGDICGGLGTPLITVCTPGTYCLEVSYSAIDGESGLLTTCANEQCIEVTENVNPPILGVVGTEVGCNGASDGTATVSISGGEAPFLIAWNDVNNTTTETVEGLPGGTYTVSVFSIANGCTASETITIFEPDGMTLDMSSEDSGCAGSSTGTATVSVSGGSPNYSYEWSTTPTQVGATATGLPANTYTVTVTDANNCTNENTVIVGEGTDVSVTIDGADIDCNGGNNGTATANGLGGTGLYDYEWNTTPIQMTQTATGLTADTYIVIITDENGCSATENITLTEPTVLSLTPDSVAPDCNDSTNGQVSVVASGGTPGLDYSYEWNTVPIQNTAIATGLGAGSYTVIVTDANDCTATETIILTAPNALSLSTTQVDVLCRGEETGEATVTVTGGTAPLSYSWDDAASQNTPTAVGLGAGLVTVIVTDDNGCSESIGVTITEPAEALSASGMSTPALCGSTNGTIDLTVEGGTSPYEYDWGAAGTDEDPTDLGAGTYTVIVTDANDCTTTTSVTVNSPDSPSATVSITNVNCFGESNGGMDITVMDGITPYTFAWSVANGGDEDLQNVIAGNYSVTVTDMAGCTVVATGVIEQPDELEATATPSPADCGIDNGSISVVVSGGTTPYDFDWPGTGNDGDQSPTDLAAGPYEVTITDANGCIILADADVIIPDGPTTSITGTNVDCNGEETGTIDLTISGGEMPYDIDWGDANLDGNEDLSDLPAGPYNVVVTDANNCSSVAQIEIEEPAILEINTSTTAVSCFGGNDGTATVTVQGGTEPYEYEWCDGQTTPVANNCPAGPCEVIVTDANGCSITATVDVAQPTELEVVAEPRDADCNGASTGSIEVTVNGGTAGYSYTWSGGIPNDTEDPGSLLSGDYDLLVTDANGCTVEILAIEIGEPIALSAQAIASQTDCGLDNGSISLTVSGGTTPYEYDWPGTANDGDQNPTDLGAGTYEVTITDGNGCTITAIDDVITPDGPTTSITGTNVGCNGEETGTIDLTITGGATPYDIDWGDANLNGNEDLSDLPAGPYTVIVTDANNCSSTAFITIQEPTILEIATSSTPVSCFGTEDGTATVTVTGGTGPYSYVWCDDQTDPIVFGCPPGPCTVIVTDANGCTITGSVDVGEPTELNVIAEPRDADCNGASTGSIEVTVSGGTSGYSYTWTNGIPADTEDPGSLGAGSYDLLVTDANGCTQEIIAIEITEPEAMSVLVETTEATCNEENGTISLTVSGGTAPYDYTWTGGLSGEDPIAVGSGNYDVAITDANGCILNQTVTVTTPAALSISSVASDAACNGEASGSVAVTVGGGTLPFSYQWNDPDGQTVEDAVNLPAGDYELIVTDDTGCTIGTTATINEPSALVLSATSTEATCNTENGTIDLTVSGGTTPYDYDWSGSAADIEDPIDLGSGSYNVTVTDGNGCTAVLNQTVETPSGLAGDALGSDASCFGFNNGSIDLTVVGGTGPGTYSYQWDDANSQTVEDPIDLIAGDYLVVVTDGDGCTIVASATVNEPALLEASGIPSEASCNEANGGIDLTVNGGTTPYTYDWSGTAADIEDPQDLLSGNYDVIVTDANGCTTTASVTVTEPDALSLLPTPSDAACNGEASGSVDLSVSGGTGPGTYSYQWDDASNQTVEDPTALLAGTYNVLVTDENGCTITTSVEINEPMAITATVATTEEICGESNGTIDLTVNGGTAPYSYDWSGPAADIEDPTDLQAGTYNVTVTDSNGCTYTNSATVNTPNELTAFATPSDAACNGEASGSIALEISGGTAPYGVVWSGGLGTDEDPQSVAAGNYTGIVTDDDGCQIIVAVTIGEPSAIMASSTPVEATCNESNGSIDMTVSGGTAPYTYTWDGGADPVEDPLGLTAGTYNVTITDDNGCTLIYAETVSTPTQLELTTTSENTNCNGDTNGSIDLTVSGGTAPFSYEWNNGPTTEDQIDLGAGVFTVIVTDGDGCTVSTSVTITQPDVLIASNESILGVSCNGGNDGSALVSVNGGTAPYNYDWSNNAFDGESEPQNMGAGMYTVTVTDANGCTSVDEVSITEPPMLELSVNSSPTLCFGGSEGSIELDVIGGTAPFAYDWSNGATEEDPQAVNAGSFTVTVTDDNGCTETISVQVNQPPALLVNIDNVSNYGGTNVSCSDATDGSAEAIGVGGTAPYTYTWSTGAQTQGVENLGAGLYEVMVTDGNGCTSSNEVLLEGPVPVNATTSVTNPICYGENDGIIAVNGSGGTSPYLYSIDGGAFGPLDQFGGLVSGVYEIMVQDVNGCEQMVEAIVSDPQELDVEITVPQDDKEIQLGDSIVLSPLTNVIPVAALDTFYWSSPLDTVTAYQVQVGPLQTTTYQITVINEFGCVDEDQIEIRVKKDRLIYIPNIFTPNEDGENDEFLIYGGQGVKEVNTFRLYNRWGEVLHEAYNFQPGDVRFAWDGRFKGEQLNPGVFVYYAEVEFLDGRIELYKGDVTLMR